MKTILLYVQPNGDCPVELWLDSLDSAVKARVYARLTRLILGNFGDYRKLPNAIIELRLMFGPGYRVYCAEHEEEIILLLCGGDKSTQYKDILTAVQNLRDFQSVKTAKAVSTNIVS